MTTIYRAIQGKKTNKILGVGETLAEAIQDADITLNDYTGDDYQADLESYVKSAHQDYVIIED